MQDKDAQFQQPKVPDSFQQFQKQWEAAHNGIMPLEIRNSRATNEAIEKKKTAYRATYLLETSMITMLEFNQIMNMLDSSDRDSHELASVLTQAKVDEVKKIVINSKKPTG